MRLSGYIRNMLLATVAMTVVIPDAGVLPAAAQQQSSRKKTSRSGKEGAEKGNASKGNSSKGKTASKSGGTAKGKKGKKVAPQGTGAKKTGGKKPGGTETSADVRRREQATQREIAETRRQIKANDQSISKGMAELGRLQGDIGESKKKLEATAAEVGTLDKRITTVTGQVASEERELERLRTEYLKAVKKMRLNRNGRSTLSFIFSSESFSQALRRMRYLKQFSDWKDRQSSEITAKVAHLKGQRDLLARTKVEKDRALRRQAAAQSQLEGQYARQDALVADLRRNGEALNAHLARKQAEANELKSRVAALIAAEQRTAEQRAAEEARKAREAEEARLLAEQKRREAEEAVRRADEMQRQAQIAKAEEEAKADKKSKPEKKKEAGKENRKQARRDKTPDKKTVAKAEPKKGGDGKKQETRKSEPKREETRRSEGNSSYAEARKRKPRGQQQTQVVTASSSEKRAATASGSGFESMRGSLPKPVAGSFRITSPFGRHSLPELPDVVYDNPGVDALVTRGTSALSVYPGKVSGVYMIPGFNTVVIVSHGNYYTVYGNISSPSVKVGDTVRQGQKLGSLAPADNDDSASSIHFEVWRNREKLNPADWIR